MTADEPGPDGDGAGGAEPPTRPSDRGLGRNYAKLWTASVVSNLGDGIDNAALPLLAEALTRDPMLFAGVAVANRLPWLVFSLHAGAIADRVDRRRLMVVANTVRFALMAVLGAAVVLDVASIGLLYLVAVGLGTFEVLFDNAAQTLMPSVVRRDQLERANGRLYGGEIVTNQFLGPPLGGLLFGISAALPILLDAGTFLVSAGLIAAMTGTYRQGRRVADGVGDAAAVAPAAGGQAVTDATAAAPGATPEPPGGEPSADDGGPRPRMTTEIREGLRWLWGHRLLRTLAILLAAMNGTAMLGMSVLGLYVVGEESVLGLGPVGFGLLLTAGAAGSLVGSVLAARVVTVLGRGRALWATLIAAVAVPLTIGLTSSVAVVAAAQVVFGLTAVTWNVITVSLRQTVIPDRLLGRVNSVYRFLGWGAMPIGGLLGGVVASLFGLRAPWLLAAALMTVALLPALGVIDSRTIEAARADAE